MASKVSTASAAPTGGGNTSAATKIRRRSLLRVRRPAWAQAAAAERKA